MTNLLQTYENYAQWLGAQAVPAVAVPVEVPAFLRADGPPAARTVPTAGLTLPVDSATRKNIPLMSGCYNYFPAALAGVASHSKKGNDKHNPGEPLHHARGKSADHGDTISRHLMDIQDMLASIARGCGPSSEALLDEASALAWRALALSQELHESMGGAPLAPAARLPE